MSKQVYDKFNTRPLNRANSEQGFVLVTALLIMVLLTVLGIAATNTTIVELRIAANERDYKRNLYKAEGAAMEAAQILEDEPDREELLPGITTNPWLKSVDDPLYATPLDLMTLVGGPAALADAVSDVRHATFARGVVKGAKGASLSMSGSTVREYSIYGGSEERGGRVMIDIGYKKRF